MTGGHGAVRLVRLTDLEPESGWAWRGHLPPDCGIDEDIKISPCSLRLFEGGTPLGPAHCLHRDIRELGFGRYSWHLGGLWFSTSDNSDPRANGREYHALLSAPGPAASLLSLAEDAADLPDNAPESIRHRLLFQLAEFVYPGFTMPDLGRRIDRDEAFHAVMRRFFPLGGVAVDRRYALREIAQLVVDLDGDIAECGSYNGASAYVMCDVLRRRDAIRPVHLFDSFSGLSDPSPADGDQWRAGDLTIDLEETRANLVEFPFVRFHPGWIPQTFAAVEDRRFALVHVDVDLYAPTLDSIRFFWDRLVPRGILICDDYGFTTCPGATLALDEFFAGRAEPIVNLPSGGAMVIKKG